MWETERRSAAMRSGILALVHAAAAQALASSEALDARRPKNCRTKWCRIQAAMLAETATRRSQFAAAENMAPPSARFRSARYGVMRCSQPRSWSAAWRSLAIRDDLAANYAPDPLT